MSTTLEAGQKAPAFSLRDHDGNTVQLADFKGRHVVLYFYPRDNTPGCTREACDFRDQHSVLQAKGAVVLGVSSDSAASHLRFKAKFELPFPLLVDAEHQLAEKYGAWGEKVFYGKKSQGVIRSTFLIDPEGNLKKVWGKVKLDGHVAQVLEALAE